MPRKKILERKVSNYLDKVHLFEITDSYVKGQTKFTGQSRAAVIRELCESARQVQMTDEQFRSGTTKIYQAVTNNLLKKNLENPLAEVNAKLAHLEVKIQEMELNARFGDEEVFRVMRLFFVENQLLSRLLHQLLESNEIEIDVAEERQAMKANYQSNYNTRKDAFFAKYEQLFMEKHIRETAESSESSDVIDASQTDQSN
jgi:hypothetical protein